MHHQRALIGLSAALAVSLGASETARAQSGACCITGGGAIICQETTEEDCANSGGVFHGAGTICAPFLCADPAPTGACCASNGQSCFTSTEANCVNFGHTWLGAGSSCDPYPCDLGATGACCLVDVQFCFDTDEFQCGIFKGVFHKGLTCADIECGDGGPGDPTGACCLLLPFGLTCAVTTEASCADSGGTFQGIDTVCDPLPCEPGTGPTGACCIIGGGAITCGVLHESHCAQLGGTFHGADTTCDPFPCSLPGDCNNDGSIDVIDLLTVIGAWGPCSPPPASCPADMAPAPNGNGAVDVNDLLMVVANWGN